MNGTKPFVVGRTYLRTDGHRVTIIEEITSKGYECVRGDDYTVERDAWRYNRDHDRGRCTGSAFDMSDPFNLIPEPLEEAVAP